MADDREFEPRLGRIRQSGAGRGTSYLRRVLHSADSSGLEKRQRSLFKGSKNSRGFGAGRILGGRGHCAFTSRRVVIKSRIVKLRGKGDKAAALHLRYIQRDGVTLEGMHGQLYGRDRDHANGGDFLQRSAEDRHQFRFIVSAEDAGQYDDLRPFVRKLMARVEADLGTSLDWVAVDHHNTGHPHTHIILRGKDELGQDLVIAPEYISNGMRERASEIVSLDLGPRTEWEVEESLTRQISQERLTDIDRILRREAAPNGELALANPASPIAHHYRVGRLQHLQQMDLAQETSSGLWRLSEGLEASLRGMGERSDIIKAMHREMGSRALALNLSDLADFDPPQAVIGRVAARGLSDLREGKHHVFIEGIDGRVHYAEIAEETECGVAVGAIVQFNTAITVPRQVDRTVEAIAQAHAGMYSPQLHRQHDPSASEEFITAHVRRLEAMRRMGGLVERRRDGTWAISDKHSERGSEFDARNAPRRIELLSARPLETLIEARARTWLDHELLTEAPVLLSGQGFGLEVRNALKARRNWLMTHDLVRSGLGKTAYPSQLLATLRDQELSDAAKILIQELGKNYVPLSDGIVEGTYRGPVDLISGKFAIIEKSREFSLAPWKPALEREFGKAVRGVARGDAVSWTIGRQRGHSIS